MPVPADQMKKAEELGQRLREKPTEDLTKQEGEDVQGVTWNPKVGDVLSGVVVARRTVPKTRRDGTVDQRELIVVREAKTGKDWAVWKATMLEDLFKKVKVGSSAVAIKFLGKRQGKENEYNVYEWDIA